MLPDRGVTRSLLRSWAFFSVAILLAHGFPAPAQPLPGSVVCPDEADSPDEKCWYGPCRCQPRKTLLQWSYGTTFSGGPELDKPLVTDRPDFTEASVTVGRGVLQIEMGYTYTNDENQGAKYSSHSYPEMLVRYGICADWLEFRLGQNFASVDDAGFRVSGAEDLYLGFKIALTPQEGLLPEMALVPQMTVPSGHRDISAGETLPGVNWLYGWEINEFLSTGGSTQFNRTIDPGTGAAYTEWAQSWTVGYTLTEKWGAYTEWFVLAPHSADTARTQHYFDSGLTYLLNADVQFDIRAGVGLNAAAADYFAGIGLSVRFK